MSKEPLVYQLAITMIPGIGAITARKLIDYLGSPEAVFREKSSSLRRIPGVGTHLSRQISTSDLVAEAEREIGQMQKYRISSVYYRDEAYPWRLKNCVDGPLLLFYRGKPAFERERMISIVGTRNASSYGREQTQAIIRELSEEYPDLVIISGLAYGIDITAHRSAMDNGLDTFAVMAHGLPTIYHASHPGSAAKILDKGTFLSDFPTSMKPERNNFLRRNRIIAGLAEATVIIESGRKGGAMITADLASSYSREVFAIPGRTTDFRSAGCNRLIKDNVAALITSGKEIAQLLGWEQPARTNPVVPVVLNNLSGDESKVLRELNEFPGLGLDILAVRTHIPVYKLSGLLLQMELNNWITVLPGNHYKALAQPSTKQLF